MSAPVATRIFTASQFAEVAGLTPETALQFLRDWVELEITEKAAGGWVLTEKGRSIALGLSLCAPPEEAA